MAKSLMVAYLLWVIGGAFGLHLFYLRRDRQVFIWWCTVCGYLGIGPLRDLIRMPTYINDINEEKYYMKKLISRMNRFSKPPFSLFRFVGQILVGNSWTYLFHSAIPKEEIFGISLHPLTYLAPLFSAIAVWVIGNIGREQGKLKWALLGSFLFQPIVLFYPGLVNWGSVSSTLVFNMKGKEWRRTPYPHKSVCKRMFTLIACFMIFLSCWLSYAYFNAEVKDKHNNKIKLRDAIKNMWNSPIAQEFKKNMKIVYDEFWDKGYQEAFDKLKEVMDPAGEHQALKVLGLDKHADLRIITSTYKALVKKWHPDKHVGKSAEEKEEISQRFIRIQKAYETLKIIKKNGHQHINKTADINE